MIIYVDVDGTLTERQRGGSAWKDPIRQDVLEKVKKAITDGHEVVVWSGRTKYARDVCKAFGISAVAAARKPDLIVDNQVRRTKRRLKNVVSPEEFVGMELK